MRMVLSDAPAIDPERAPVLRVKVFGRKPNFENPLGNEPWKGSARSTSGGPVMSRGEAISIRATFVVAEWVFQKAIQRRE